MKLKIFAGACVLVGTALISGCTGANGENRDSIQFQTPNDFLDAWIDNGGQCSNPESVSFLDFQNGKLVQCQQQNGLPVWFASQEAADAYAEVQVENLCVRGTNWVISGVDTSTTVESIKAGLNGQDCY
ncbi:MAG: hypothetical protein RLZZ108_1049 [Actinomycetota bacterium]